MSLGIFYSSGQDEKLTSPEIIIPQNGSCSFYACFDGVWQFDGSAKLIIDADGEQTKIFDSFEWSQENAHEGSKWMSFKIDLAKFAGKTAKFILHYVGSYGEDFVLDDFKINSVDSSEDAKVTILETESVKFIDLSEGEAIAWNWKFNGGTPSTSTEQNPTIVYNTAGKYDVELTVTFADGTDSKTKTEFVTVTGVAPTAIIGYPEEGYMVIKTVFSKKAHHFFRSTL